MRIIRAIVFVVFFSIGFAVLSATVLCDDLLKHFYLKGLDKQNEGYNGKLKSLIADYDVVIGQLEGDPCQIARLAPATLGIEPNEPNTAYPRASADKLAAAKQALSEEPNEPTPDKTTPEWLGLCCQWPRRHILFFCGAALMLVSFVFFGSPKRSSRSITVTTKESPGAKK